jgi:hypothetical protein
LKPGNVSKDLLMLMLNSRYPLVCVIPVDSHIAVNFQGIILPFPDFELGEKQKMYGRWSSSSLPPLLDQVHTYDPSFVYFASKLDVVQTLSARSK